MLFPELAQQSEWGLLALRIAVGIIFIVHGWPKLATTRSLAAGMGGGRATPALIGMIFTQGLVEVGGGIFLILGLLTQLVAIGFMLIMVGAILLKTTRLKTGFMAMQTTGWEFDFVLLAANLLLFFTGPGRLAIQS
jgi:putative oxidoreductase